MVLQGPGGSRRHGLGRRLLPWILLVLAVGVLAMSLGVPWWIPLGTGVAVILWVVFEP